MIPWALCQPPTRTRATCKKWCCLQELVSGMLALLSRLRPRPGPRSRARWLSCQKTTEVGASCLLPQGQGRSAWTAPGPARILP